MLPHRAVLLCGSLLAACTEPAPKEGPAPTPSPPAEAAKVETPPAPVETKVEVKAETPPTPAAAVTLDSKVGVAACDDYVARYRACLEKVLARERESHTTALLGQLRTWVAAQADPKRAPALEGECTAAAEAARASTRVFGCVWREGDSETPEAPKGGKDRPQPRGRVPIDPLEL
jgi:hypothetical protein